eukprot:SAG31_NODE_615_length_13521_cov_43.196916_13_plen_493_part_00
MWDAPAWNPPDSPPEDYHETLRLEGNARFEAKEYAAAAERYTEALGLLPERDRQSSQGSVLLSNLAAARLAQGRFEECLHDCNIGMSCKNATPEIRGKLYKRAAQAQTRLNKVSELYSAATTANKHWDSVRAMAQHDRALAGLESGELANAMRAKLLCGRSEVHAAMGSCKAALADAQMSVQVASTAEGRAAVMWGRIISDLEETKAKEQLSAAKAKFSAETESLRDSNVELRWQIHELKAELAATSAASEVQSHGALRFEALRVQSELTEWASSTVDMGRQTPRAASLNTVPVAQGASSTTNNPMDGLYWESTCPLCQLRSVVHPREVALLAAEARREMDQLGARMFVVQSRSLLSGRSKPWEEKWGTGWYAVRNKKKGTEEERRYFYIMPVGLPTGASKVNTTPRANSAKIKKGGWGLDEKHEALEVRKYCEAEFAKINWCRVGDLQDTNKVVWLHACCTSCLLCNDLCFAELRVDGGSDEAGDGKVDRR